MRRILICLLLLALLCGCTGQMLPAGKSKFTFYYRRADAQNDESYVSASGALQHHHAFPSHPATEEMIFPEYRYTHSFLQNT